MGGQRTVFVAYASHDDVVPSLLLRLSVASTEWQLVRIGIRSDWWQLAESAITTCDLFVFVDTPAARRSFWCDRELAAARDNERRILIVTLDELTLMSDKTTGLNALAEPPSTAGN